MDVYLVRHAETASNKKHRFQSATESLSQQGVKQARTVRHSIHDLNPTHLICSPLTRARETAGIIAADQSLPVETNILFREVDRPPHLEGLKHANPKSLWYMLHWLFWSGQSYWENVKGEPLHTFNNRLLEAKHYLETFSSDDTIVVVSHSFFIAYFSSVAKRNKPVSRLRALLILLKIKLLKNGGLTHLQYNVGTGEWKR